jgi:hypothetical protein
LGAALVTLLGAACSAQPSVERTFDERAPVVEGEPSEAGIEDAVLLLRTVVDRRELVCSASLVAPNLAMTARHCVSHVVEGLFSCTVSGELVEGETGSGRLGNHLPAEGIEFFGGPLPHDEPLARGQEVISTLSETVCLNDLAFVVLDRPIELPVLPLRLEGRARTGELAILVGYGLDETQSENQPFDVTTQGRTRKADLPIRDVGPDSIDDGVTIVPPRTIVLEGPSGCVGDSGGPLMAERTNAVLGVYSLLGAESCLATDARHLFTHVPPFQALIEEAFLAAGAEPTLEPMPRGFGEPCDDARECEGERCVEFPNEGLRCTTACGADDCPDGFECNAEVSDEPVCVPAPDDPGGDPDGSAGAAGAGSSGAAGAQSEPEGRRPRRASGGCAFGVVGTSTAPFEWALALLFGICALRRRRQRRPSSGSSGGAFGASGLAGAAGRGRDGGAVARAAETEGAAEAGAIATVLDASA